MNDNDRGTYRPGDQIPPDSFVGNSELWPHGPGPQGYQPKPPKKKRHTLRNVLIVVGSLFGLLIVAAVLSGGQQPAGTTSPSPVVTSVDNGPTPDPVVTPTNKPSAAKPTQPAPKPTKAAPKLTAGQEQAIGKAGEYLRSQAFSRSGLIGQLVFEGFSTKDATYGVDHVAVSWNEQAAKKAREYLGTQHFSRSGLIGQLEFDGFTHSQAVYGVTKAGL
jgi:hypothetical protein